MFRNLVSKMSRMLGSPTPPTDRILAEDIFEDCPNARPTELELSEVRRLQAAYANTWRAANIEFTHQAARAVYSKLCDEHRAAIRSGTMAESKVRPFEDFCRDFEAKQLCAKHELRLLCEECGLALAPIRARFIEAVGPYLERLERNERLDAEKLGLSHQPSARVTALRTMLTRLKNQAAGPAYGRPQHILPFLNLEEN